MTLQVFRDGRPDRSANKINNALLAKLQRDDNHAQILNEFLAKDTQSGSYGFQGVVGDSSKGITVPKAMTAAGTRAERVARVRERMASGEPVKSLFFDEMTETEILAEEDAEAYEEGWICPECLQYQAVVSSTCNWRFVGERPSDPKHWGCGYRRDIL